MEHGVALPVSYRHLQNIIKMDVNFIDDCFHTVSRIFRTLLDTDANMDLLEHSSIQLSAIYRNLQRARSIPRISELTELVESVHLAVERYKDVVSPAYGFMRPIQQRQPRGRPLYYISKEQLLHLIETGFSSKQIANMLHVSQSLVKKRLRHFGIRIRAKYSVISDNELDEIVTRLTADNRNLGQRMVQATLRTEGHVVQRQRVADSLIRVDEVGVAMRWGRTIKRRQYKVSGPNALWHIDGNHKLIRWGFVIHGGIDGYSRMVTFLRVSTNNAASTMTEAFMSGIEGFGVPSRVRSDHGLENTGVGAFMLGYRGVGRGSFITGRSVHNQRIERLWRDLFQSCTNVFHSLFGHMENEMNINLTNDNELWCLHYVFVPRIQRALQAFMDAWNNHSLRTEGGKSPKQLFLEGIYNYGGQGQRGIDDLVYEPPVHQLTVPEEEYGVDEADIITVSGPDRIVNLSNRPIPLSDQKYQELQQLFNPTDAGNLDIECYNNVLDFVQRHQSA